jgi:DNA-binding MarR family transcriptional regulator
MKQEENKDTIEYRIISYLRKNYPVKLEDLRKHLKISNARLERAIKKLEARGVLTIDRVSDTVYVHLVHYPKRSAPPSKWDIMYR